MEKEDMKELLELVDNCKSVILGSVDGQGYPNAKAMQKIVHEGILCFYFSTFTSAIRTRQYLSNPKSCLYFFRSEGKVAGLMLTGDMEVLTDAGTKQKFWEDEWKVYYPLGVTDPDYCILKFTARSGNYNCGPKRLLFDI